jgi:hypothetical protein
MTTIRPKSSSLLEVAPPPGNNNNNNTKTTEQHIRPCLKTNGRYNKAATKSATTTTTTTTTSTDSEEDATTTTTSTTPIKINKKNAKKSSSFKTANVIEHYDALSLIVEDASCVAACMSKEEYKDQMLFGFNDREDDTEEEDSEQPLLLSTKDPNQLTMGYHLFPEEDDDNDEEDDGNMIWLVSNSCKKDNDDEEIVRNDNSKKRAFLVLWETFAGWITPEACEVVEYYRSNHENEEDLPRITVDTSDIGSSRCAGLMSILSLHLSKAIQELGLSDDELGGRRRIQHRLTLLLMRLDYTYPMVKLDQLVLWRVLTVIFVAIVTPERQEIMSKVALPECAVAAGLTGEEYHYLINSLFRSLSSE